MAKEISNDQLCGEEWYFDFSRRPMLVSLTEKNLQVGDRRWTVLCTRFSSKCARPGAAVLTTYIKTPSMTSGNCALLCISDWRRNIYSTSSLIRIWEIPGFSISYGNHTPIFLVLICGFNLIFTEFYLVLIFRMKQ